MVSSINKKLENSGEFNDVDGKNLHESDNLMSSENREALKVLKKIATQQDKKQEINLPKGRLLLFKSAKDYSDQNKMFGKSYSKKWLDDISDNLCLSPMQLLKDNFDEDVGCLLDDSTQNSVKVGKSTNDLVSSLWNKTGKDRYMQKIPYKEYMPYDFDSKVGETIKSATPSMNRATSRVTSAFSFAQDDLINTDDYFEEIDPRTKNYSRLSSQPVLSTRQLISRLSCKNDIEDIESNVPDVISDEPNLITTNYKDTFFLDEVRSSISSSSTSSMQVEEQENMIKIHIDSTSSFDNNKKILKKRPNIENKIEQNYHKINEIMNENPFSESKHTNSTEEFVLEEHHVPISIDMRDEKKDDSVRPESANENLPNLKSYRSVNSFQNKYQQQRYLFSRYSNGYQNVSENNPNNIIRIRRVFDGETLKINQMNLNPTESKLDSLKHVRNTKSANVSQSKSKSKRLIKSAEQRSSNETNLETDIITNLVESLVSNTNTKTPSDMSDSLDMRENIPDERNLKKDRKQTMLSHRNSITSARLTSVTNDNVRKTKSAGSKVRFNENLLQPVDMISFSLKKNQTYTEQTVPKTDETVYSSNLEESILESKIIELKDVSQSKLVETDQSQNDSEYQKSISQISFTEETKSYTLSSQDREQFDNEEEEEIINDVLTANLEKTNDIDIEMKKIGEESKENKIFINDEIIGNEENYSQDKLETKKQVLESAQGEEADVNNLEKPFEYKDLEYEKKQQNEETVNEGKEEKKKIEIFLQRHEFSDQDSEKSKEFLNDLHDQSMTNEPLLGIINENVNGDLLTEYLKKPFKKVEISNIVVERTISEKFFEESVAKLEYLDVNSQLNQLDQQHLKEEEEEINEKHEVRIIKPAPELLPDEIRPYNDPRLENKEMTKIITKLPPKPGKKISSKKSKKHKVHNQINFNESNVLDDEQVEILKEKKRQLLLKIEQMKAQLDPKHVYPKYTYLQIPYQYQDPIVDHNEFSKAFHIPEKICPQIHKIDPRTTSIEQLDLEKRIMEERIRDLFIKKTAAFNSGVLVNEAKKKTQKKKTKAKETKSDDVSVKKEKKPKETNKTQKERKESKEIETDLKESNEKISDLVNIEDGEELKKFRDRSESIKEQREVKDLKVSKTAKEGKEHNDTKEKEPTKKEKKELAPKSKLNQDERMRLYNEALNKQIERDNIYNMILKNITDKEEEIEQLNEELEKNNHEFEQRLKTISEQIVENEMSKNDVIKLMVKSKKEYLEKLNIKFENERKYQRIRFEEIKQEKLEELDFKKKECEFIASIYSDPNDKAKALRRVVDLDDNYEKWMVNFEVRMTKEEHQLDDKLNDEEDMFINLHHEEEEIALKPYYEENLRLLNEKNELNENFDDIKLKIITRIQTLKDEIISLKSEKTTIEETTERNIQLQTAKLNELLQIEKEAKDKIKGELENYRLNIMKIREKNLKLKYDLSMLKHSHGITKPYVFSYHSEFPNYEKSDLVNNQSNKIVVKK